MGLAADGIGTGTFSRSAKATAAGEFPRPQPLDFNGRRAAASEELPVRRERPECHLHAEPGRGEPIPEVRPVGRASRDASHLVPG